MSLWSAYQGSRRGEWTRERAAAAARFLIERALPVQRRVLADECPLIALCTPRRASKSTTWQLRALIEAIRRPGAQVVIAGLTRDSVRQSFWNDLKRLCLEAGIPYDANEVMMLLRLPEGSWIRCVGLSGPEDADRLRGTYYHLVVVDEAQSFDDEVLRNAITEVFLPALGDYGGVLALAGTPGPTLQGLFWEIATGRPDGEGRPVSRRAGSDDAAAPWSFHTWSLADNISAAGQNAWKTALAMKAALGWPDDHPTWRREYLGEWVSDDSALVYYLGRPGLGTFGLWQPDHGAPLVPPGEHRWEYVVGIDLGYHDPTAFVTLAWSPTCERIYEVDAFARSEMTLDEIVDYIEALEDRLGQPLQAKAIDTAGSAALTTKATLQKLWGLATTAQRKGSKVERIGLMNSEQQHGRFLVRAGSPLLQQFRNVVWNEERTKEARGCRDDLCDAALGALMHVHRSLRAAPAAVDESLDPAAPDYLDRVEARARARYRASAANPEPVWKRLIGAARGRIEPRSWRREWRS